VVAGPGYGWGTGVLTFKGPPPVVGVAGDLGFGPVLVYTDQFAAPAPFVTFPLSFVGAIGARGRGPVDVTFRFKFGVPGEPVTTNFRDRDVTGDFPLCLSVAEHLVFVEGSFSVTSDAAGVSLAVPLGSSVEAGEESGVAVSHRPGVVRRKRLATGG